MATGKLLAEWFWIDRWVGSNGFLLPAEARGVYREMLTQAWRRGAQLPNDHELIQRACGLTVGEWRRSWPRIERFWRVSGDFLVNDTQLEIYADALRRTEVQAERSKRGGKARWEQARARAQAHAQAPAQASAQAQPEHVLKECPPSPSPSLREREDSLSRKPARMLAEDEIAERAGNLVRRYQALYAEHRHGAKYRQRENLDWTEACSLVPLWSDVRLEKLAILVLTTDDPWISRTDRSFKIFALKASWADGVLTEWEHEHGVAV